MKGGREGGREGAECMARGERYLRISDRAIPAQRRSIFIPSRSMTMIFMGDVACSAYEAGRALGELWARCHGVLGCPTFRVERARRGWRGV